MGTRRAAREAAMRILYSVEFSGLSVEQAAGDYWASHHVSEKTSGFSMNIVNGVDRNRKELDALIKTASRNWPLERMAAVDRTIVRMAAFELKEMPDTPTAVIVDEAVEIAKVYSAPDSPSFINGVLSKIVEHTRGENGKVSKKKADAK